MKNKMENMQARVDELNKKLEKAGLDGLWFFLWSPERLELFNYGESIAVDEDAESAIKDAEAFLCKTPEERIDEVESCMSKQKQNEDLDMEKKMQELQALVDELNQRLPEEHFKELYGGGFGGGIELRDENDALEFSGDADAVMKYLENQLKKTAKALKAELDFLYQDLCYLEAL